MVLYILRKKTDYNASSMKYLMAYMPHTKIKRKLSLKKFSINGTVYIKNNSLFNNFNVIRDK